MNTINPKPMKLMNLYYDYRIEISNIFRTENEICLFAERNATYYKIMKYYHEIKTDIYNKYKLIYINNFRDRGILIKINNNSTIHFTKRMKVSEKNIKKIIYPQHSIDIKYYIEQNNYAFRKII